MICKQGERCVRLCQQVLHCLLCEERVVAPDTHTIIGKITVELYE